MIIGLIAGGFLNYVSDNSLILEFQTSFSDLFLIILLPPILFESAINMEKVFYKYLLIAIVFLAFWEYYSICNFWNYTSNISNFIINMFCWVYWNHNSI